MMLCKQARLTWTSRERKPGPLTPSLMTLLRRRYTTCLLGSRYRLAGKCFQILPDLPQRPLPNLTTATKPLMTCACQASRPEESEGDNRLLKRGRAIVELEVLCSEGVTELVETRFCFLTGEATGENPTCASQDWSRGADHLEG